VLGLLHKHRIEKVLVVDDDFALKGMITVKDFQKATEFRARARTNAVRSGSARPSARARIRSERAAALRDAGVDVIVVDTAHGHSKA